MKKYVHDLRVVAVEHPTAAHALLKLSPAEGRLPEIDPGQFVEVRVADSPSTFLRRPISVNYVDREANELWLLVHVVGDGTLSMSCMKVGDQLDCLYPLGNGFSMPDGSGLRVLLVGGGVGTAPLVYYGSLLKQAGCHPTFLLGGRSAKDLLQLSLFERYGDVFVTTEDGTMGERGFVTDHSVLCSHAFDRVATCGPKPMMVAVARWAKAHRLYCEASLENLMACGLGACLCCVEKTAEGHNVCVCKEGPVFNTEKLRWLY